MGYQQIMWMSDCEIPLVVLGCWHLDLEICDRLCEIFSKIEK